MRSLRGSVLHEPKVERHVCGPGWEWSDEWNNYFWREPWDIPLGTVVECDCGQTWVCYLRPRVEGRRFVAFERHDWRRETRRERKRRERRAGRIGAKDEG